VDLKKDDWILSFNGKSLTNPKPDGWKVKKDKGDFDQFTGATITPRAVVQQVLKTLQYYKDDKARLIKAAIEAQPVKETISNATDSITENTTDQTIAEATDNG
jgi:hypothetical protein